jgi:hypothetical protein
MRANAVLSFVSCLWLCIGVVGCGDDGDSSDGGVNSGGTSGGGSGGNGGGGSGGRDPLPVPDGGGGTDASVAPGEGLENEPCSTTADCVEDLTCVDSSFGFGICARACVSDTDCGAELCISLTNNAADAHCTNTVRNPFVEYCGALETAICSEALELRCLLLSDLPIGICANLCSSGGADAGVSEDTCEGDYECVGGIVQDNGDGIDGVCGNFVERGAPCGIMMGTFCEDGDICTPVDPNFDPETEETEFLCHADCTEPTVQCPGGTTCTAFRDIAFCKFTGTD